MPRTKYYDGDYGIYDPSRAERKPLNLNFGEPIRFPAYGCRIQSQPPSAGVMYLYRNAPGIDKTMGYHTRPFGPSTLETDQSGFMNFIRP